MQKTHCYSLTKDYVQRKRRFRRGGTHTHTNTNSTLSILKKEFREGNLHSLFGLQSSSSSSEPEQWLSSFISNTPSLLDVDQPPPPPPPTAQPHAATSAKSMAENTHKDLLRRYHLLQHILLLCLIHKVQFNKETLCLFFFWVTYALLIVLGVNSSGVHFRTRIKRRRLGEVSLFKAYCFLVSLMMVYK